MSIAGGYFKAVETAHRCGCDCVQLFTKNNNQWRAKPITEDDVQRFHSALRRCGIRHPVAHDSYLINLASPDTTLWKKSIDALVEELERAGRLGLAYVVAHPGAFTTSSEKAGLRRIIWALNQVHGRVSDQAARCLLETTAGQGTNLGWRFGHLASILDGVKHPEKLGVCFDTCHVFAAGYPMQTEKQYRDTMTQLRKTVGIDKVRAVHLNDSKADLASRVDRHEHIGKGKMGLAPFRWLLNDRRFRRVPMYLETPKGTRNGVELDVINLRTLRRLIKKNRR